MYFRKTCFRPCWSFVSFGIWRNVWGCVQDWNKPNRKGITGKKKVAEYIRTYVACIELCVTSWQSQAISGSQKVREGGRERECCLWKSKGKREGTVIVSREYIWLILVMWSAPNARDKIKVADVFECINHVTFLTNRFSRLVSLPTSVIFVSEQVNQYPIF